MRENMQRFQRHFTAVWGQLSNFADTIWRPSLKFSAKSPAVFLLLFFLLVGAFVSTRLLNTPDITGPTITKISERPRQKIEIPLNCSAYSPARTCPSNYPTTYSKQDDLDRPLPSTCPDYFRWIYEDLRPWAHTGISRDMVDRAKRTANFRLVILNGKAYVESHQKAFQTRDVFTLWGILQLLRRYPGRVPDLELMFDCVDWPIVLTKAYSGPDATSPPPLFRYCGDDNTLDIVFPDWSFWGWPEINIKPWKLLLKELEEGNKRSKWVDREPFAYWKGNPIVAATRQDLLKCNVSDNQDWNARVYAQDWIKESKEGYKQSDLASQCIHRYKIYIEGSAWSVSEKYILACDSVTLLVKPHYYDFFTRGLVPNQHYWPIKDDDKCRSIKFAVDWGNSHQQKKNEDPIQRLLREFARSVLLGFNMNLLQTFKRGQGVPILYKEPTMNLTGMAKSIGKAASRFMQEELKMEYVYDYMFHLLNEYAKLLQFKPTIPEKAVEFCSESMACTTHGLRKKFMMDSMVKGPADNSPCTMPPPYGPSSLYSLIKRRTSSIQQVEMWQNKFWENQNKQP